MVSGLSYKGDNECKGIYAQSVEVHAHTYIVVVLSEEAFAAKGHGSRRQTTWE